MNHQIKKKKKIINYLPSLKSEGEPINLYSDTETDDYKLIKESYEALTTKNKEL